MPAGQGEAREAAQRIVKLPQPVRDALVATLDDWISIARHPEYKVEEPHLEWLKEVVAEADPDPWRKALRTASAETDSEKRNRALEELAEAPDLTRQPLP